MPLDVSQVLTLAVDLGKASAKATILASRVVAKTAQQVEATAKTLCPVDTGNLRNSIGSDIRTLTAEIGPTAAYGLYVEFGTSRMAPQAFMGPGLDANAEAFYAAMEQVAAQALG